MATQQQSNSGSTAADNATHQSTLKSILVHIQDDASLEQRLEAALSLARPTSAHLSCIHATPIQSYVAFDTFGGMFVMKDVMEAIDKQAGELRQRVEAKLRAEDVTWDYEEITGHVPTAIISRAALSDLMVAGREPHRQDFVGPATQLLGDLLYRCRVPLFLPGSAAEPPDPMGTAVIAWDGSYEAANAVRASIGLLKLAGAVAVLQVEEKKDERFPGTKLLEYLSRHGISAELKMQRAAAGSAGSEIAAALIASALGLGASYLVAGGYSHSRVGEYIFGGVTRQLLRECPVGLVIAH